MKKRDTDRERALRIGSERSRCRTDVISPSSSANQAPVYLPAFASNEMKREGGSASRRDVKLGLEAKTLPLYPLVRQDS
jgi:hypothetical protein